MNDKQEDIDWEQVWDEMAHPLRNVSAQEIEVAISEALSKLTCKKLKVHIKKLDFQLTEGRGHNDELYFEAFRP